MKENKACALSGHRILKKNFDINGLRQAFLTLIDRGYTEFLCGMARGFDLTAYKILLELKKEGKKIYLKACIPCKNQDKYYTVLEKKEYRECIDKSDFVIYICNKYLPGCMQMRNRYMVDNADILLAYIYKSSGGTYYTVNYAESKKREIIFIN